MLKKVAFMVDGNFLFSRVKYFKSFFVDGPGIRAYCLRHLGEDEELYRIFYYDAPPLDRKGKDPLGADIDFGESPAAVAMKKRLDSIRETPNMALRLGKTAWQNDWSLSQKTLKDLLAGNRKIADLAGHDFIPNIRQKAVDMKIGLDIATIAYKRLVNRVVLIAGDADFVPASKLARSEGLQVTLDPMGAKIPADLMEHIDWARNALDPEDKNDVRQNKQFFVRSPKSMA